MELWDVYDERGRKQSGTLVRGEPIPRGQYHLVSCVLVQHENGDYLLLLRSPQKKVSPNCWEIGTGGSALRGESSEACARRELLEETGIRAEQLQFLDRLVEPENGTIYDGYLCVTDQRQSILQPEETVDYRWVSKEIFLKFFDSDACIPRIRTRLRPYVDRLRESC